MEQSELNKIVSMIIQDLRHHNHSRIIEIVKQAEYSIEETGYDNWNGGVYFYRLIFHLKYSDFARIVENKEEYENILENSLNGFYKNDSEIIQGVSIIAKIAQFVDWEAISPKENKESILKLIDEELNVLIKIGTGILRIQDVNDQYIKSHRYLCEVLKSMCLEQSNEYSDLWDWYNDYNYRKLSTYQSRRSFIKNLYQPLLAVIENSEYGESKLVKYEPTGWEKIDLAVQRMKDVLVDASITADFQSVGMYGRELLISLAQLVFNKNKHPSMDGTDIGNADSKRMLEAYINYCLKHKSHEREVKFAKSSIDFSNELTHNRTATAMDSELCYNAVISTVHIIRVLNKFNR